MKVEFKQSALGQLRQTPGCFLAPSLPTECVTLPDLALTSTFRKIKWNSISDSEVIVLNCIVKYGK